MKPIFFTLPTKKNLTLPVILLVTLSLPAFAEETKLDTIVITATRNEIPLERVGSSLTVITEKEIQQRGYTSVAEILRSTVGITTTNAGGTGSATAIRIRGEEGFRTKILVDGVDAADATGTQIYTLTEHISLAEIERIEILRGPQGMMYGADAGGVVNIITKRAKEKFAGNARTETGRYNTFNNSGNVRGKAGVFDYSVSASNQATDGFNARTSDTTLRDKDGYDNRTLNGRFGVDITDNIHTQLTLRNTDAEHDYDGCFDASFTPSDNCKDDYAQKMGRLDISHSNDVLKQTLSYAETTTDHDFFTNEISSFYSEGETTQAQYVANLFVNKTSTLLFGVDQKEERITDDGAGGEFERDQTGLYTEWQSSIGSQFFYTVGARNDDNDDFGNHTTYRTTAAWVQPVGSDTVKYKTSYGTGFRAPSLYEISYNKGPFATPPASLTTLKEETSKGFDAGVEFHAVSGLFLEAVYFDQKIEDAIDFDLIGFSGYVQTAGETDSRGVELSADIPVTDILAVFGNYTYNDTETDAGDQRIRRPRHYGSAGLRTTLNKVKILASMRFANDAEDAGGVKLNDYQVYDLTANYALTESIELFVRGENIFNNDYQEAIGYNVAGAAVYTGVRAKF